MSSFDASGRYATGSENGGDVKGAGGLAPARQSVRTDSRLTVRAARYCFRCPKGRCVAGMRYGTRPTGALDEVPASMLKVHGRLNRSRIAHSPEASKREVMTAETYTCANCGGTFEKGWSDEDAHAERERDWPGHKVEDCALICDDCHQKFMAWFRTDEVTAL